MASRTQYPPRTQRYGGTYPQQEYRGAVRGGAGGVGAYRQPRQNMMQQHKSNPNLRATFTPGGVDDFYMPEVISPAPQRVMPEVPENIQENLAYLELEANPPRKGDGPWSPSAGPGRLDHLDMASTPLPPRRSSLMPSESSDRLSRAPARQEPEQQRRATSEARASMGGGYAEPPAIPHQHDYRLAAVPSQAPPEQPSFSPFPRLVDPPANVPPSDDEKEATLEQARLPVLNSNDPEMQLAWAQDALAYVEVAIQHELRMAEIQTPRAQTPQVEHQLRVDAISIVSFLADQHHPRAEFMRGMWLEFGKFGFRVDKKEAFRCYSRAAENGYARAEYRIGMQYESSNDPAKAIKHYDKGVALGDSASSYRLGMMTLLGQHGQPQDFAKGVHLIRYAAQHADENAPQGAYVYGMLQAHELEHLNIPELFLPLDINGARINIEKAAYLGFAKAQLKMGSAYELCQLGCDFNPALSLHYNALAARQGEAEADMAISKWFLCGYDSLFAKNDELAFTYAQRAARSGLPTAEFAMGYFCEIGMFTPVDLKEAQRWYEMAAEHGNKDAVGRIDGLSRSNTLSRKDHEEMAIARIRSQYGSQRGKRPERFRSASNAMPTISDERLDMPEPPAPGPRGSGDAAAHHQNVHDIGGPPDRATSATPYPMEDNMVPDDRRPASGATAYGVSPALRPSSAFGINPNLHAQSASGMRPPSSGAAYYRGSQGPPRPNTAAPAAGAAWGRGGGPMGRGARVSSGPVPPGYRTPGMLSPENQPQEMATNPPRLDIGFSAPPDPALDRTHRMQMLPGGHPLNSPSPTNARMGYEPMLSPPPGGPPRRPLRSSRDNSPSASNPSLASMLHDGGAPPSRASRSSSPHTRHQLVDRPAPANAAPVAAASRPPSGKPPRAADSSPARVPGKGPKTFEEMGVPLAAKESDCILM
ncbi:MAG: hypothetical protein M1838_005347 [Thelocarpon superellum]|nr:MAG: hypothetical protein M1838_005347 [Thelocarpon superellum]